MYAQLAWEDKESVTFLSIPSKEHARDLTKTLSVLLIPHRLLSKHHCPHLQPQSLFKFKYG